MVAALAALIGGALGWRIPFGGQQRGTDQRLGIRQPTAQSTSSSSGRRLGNPRTPQTGNGVAQVPQTTTPTGATNQPQEPSDTTVKPPLW